MVQFSYISKSVVLILAGLFLCIPTIVFSQVKNVKENKKKAKTYISLNDYNRALKENLVLFETNKYDVELNKTIGICYLNINDDKSKALPYLEFVFKSGKYQSDLFLMLGMAYMYSYDFEKALTYFNQYKARKDAKEQETVALLIQNCLDAKELIKNPIDVTFENLGKELNTAFPDYYPFVTKDEGTMYFTSRRDATLGNIQSWQGYFTSDIYISKVVNGQWGKAKNMGPIVNSQEDEQCVYLTSDGKIMMVYVDNDKTSGDLFLTSIGGKIKNFPKPIPFEEPINTDYSELEACISEDGTTLFFASDRSGGVGNMDIYMSKKLPNGSWGTPTNLGTGINTKYNEGFPVYDEVNQVLYFSSEGHKNMGGYDIFKSKYNTATKTFDAAINIGYPINTPEDNMQFSLAGNRRDAYISAYRKEGYGDLDIYKITFNEVENLTTVLKGKVYTVDSLAAAKDVELKVVEGKSKEVLFTKSVKLNTGTFLFPLKPGAYFIEASCDGYELFSKSVSILDKSSYSLEKKQDVLLIDKNAASAVTPAKKPTIKKK